jgi:glycosyltransferase involved in cell wall biosynthesis
MKSKPELIVFSIYLMGGGASFHRNLIANRPDDFFDIKCIYLNPLHWAGKRSDDVVLDQKNVVFDFDNEPIDAVSERLEKLISNREGIIITNFEFELATLKKYKKDKKAIYFICQDDAYIYLAKKYESIIDVFISHNIAVFDEICNLIPHRKNDINFIQHGVEVQKFERKYNIDQNLRLVFLARHVKLKGIYDLPIIDEQLKKSNIEVDWLIMGDGEEKQSFVELVKDRKNFKFFVPKTTPQIIDALKNIDLYILPSSLDGLPVSLLESMSVGCVPIVYNFSEGIKKVITSDIGYVIENKDTTATAQKIAFLSENRDELINKSKSCYAKVNNEFDIKKQSALYFELYKKYKFYKRKRFYDPNQIKKILKQNSFFVWIYRIVKKIIK